VSNGKTALVTGGSRGIGRGIAFELAKAGYDLTIGHWEDDVNAAATAERIRAEWGRRCLIAPGDLADPATPAAIVGAALKEMGRIDVLVNNAGICKFRSVTELSLEETDRLIQVNFRAPLLMMKEVSRHMREAGIRGSILNVTSSRAERAYPGDAVYGGLKAALKRASESAALDLAQYGIRVNCIAPGATLLREDVSPSEGLGRRIPLGRMGKPEDMGHIAVWLSSDQASYITGITVRADGGLILPGMPENEPASAGWAPSGGN
jgi:NAD(P)-dependent dehydrogenase (short-subunit alcohol dehydrogenase family)